MGAEPTALKTSLTLVGLVAAGTGAGSVIIFIEEGANCQAPSPGVVKSVKFVKVKFVKVF